MRPINLLPPEALEKAKLRRRRFLWVLAGLAFLALLAVATLWMQNRVNDRKEELQQREAEIAALQQEVAELGEFAALKAEFDGAVLILTSALSGDVGWGRILNDLARTIPDRVWITSFSALAVVGEAGTVGEISLGVTGFDFPDVAAWLRSLDSSTFPSVDKTWVTGISVGTIGEVPVVNFNSSTFLTPEALTDRLEQRIPDLS